MVNHVKTVRVANVGWARFGRERLLRAAGLDIEFTRAEGDRVEWESASGGRSAIDLVGGFGSTLIGHNHPEVLEALSQHVSERRPSNVQASYRGSSELLKARLRELLEREYGQPFSVLLLSTGTEAVEAALKHARLEFRARQQALQEQTEAHFRRLRRRKRDGALEPSPEFLRECERALGCAHLEDIDALQNTLAARNRAAFQHPGRVVAIEGGFHGKTMGALEVTWNPDARLPFVREPAQARFVKPGHKTLAEVQAELSVELFELAFEPLRLEAVRFNGIAALICEPIRGEGGVFELESELVDELREYRNAHPEVPVIVDEIQTGLGRTGLTFESVRWKLCPDYLTLGKSLGGGIAKVSALAVRQDRYIDEYSLLHTSTFAEDELSSSIALRALHVIERDDVRTRSARLGAQLRERLEQVRRRWPNQLADVRGRGLMLGIELSDQSESPSAVIRALANEDLLTMAIVGHLLHDHGIRIMPTVGRRTVLRVQPSAYLDETLIEKIGQAMECVCHMLSAGDAGALIRYLVRPQACGQGCELSECKPALRNEPAIECRSRVAFLGHFIRAADLAVWDPSLARYDERELEQLLRKLHGLVEPRVVSRHVVQSTTGAATELSFIGIFMTSEQIERDLRENQGREIRAQVFAAHERAHAHGCSLVGFGGYTSIVTMNCTEFEDDRAAVTTGNALTVGMGYEALRRAADELNIALRDATVAVCGAAGNIGQVYAKLIAPDCGALSLIGRPGSARRLEALARSIVSEMAALVRRGELGQGALFQRFVDAYRAADCPPPDAPDLLKRVQQYSAKPLIEIHEERAKLRAADVIVGVSNSATPVIAAADLDEHRPVLICDIAVPSDVAPDVATERPNVRVVSGGVVALPCDPDFALPGVPLPLGETFACAAEAMVLGLSGVACDFSRGALTTAQVREVTALAKLHGFRLGSYKTTRVY